MNVVAKVKNRLHIWEDRKGEIAKSPVCYEEKNERCTVVELDRLQTAGLDYSAPSIGK